MSLVLGEIEHESYSGRSYKSFSENLDLANPNFYEINGAQLWNGCDQLLSFL